MIQYVALIWFKNGTTEQQIDALIGAITAVRVPGQREYRFATNAGIRAGTADAAIVATFDDEAAYSAYDSDPEHLRIRRDFVGPVVERIEKCHLRV